MDETTRIANEARRFEEHESTDLALWPHCTCWVSTPGSPFVKHPGGCLCPCHGGRRS